MKIKFALIFNVLLIGNVDVMYIYVTESIIKTYYESYMAY